jgi:ketosteroid isomerase-like protein
VAATYRGHDGVRAFMADFYEVWESIRIEPRRYEDLGDRALGLFHFVGTGRGGVPVEREGGHIVKVEDGLIIDLEAYGSWADTRAAADVE